MGTKTAETKGEVGRGGLKKRWDKRERKKRIRRIRRRKEEGPFFLLYFALARTRRGARGSAEIKNIKKAIHLSKTEVLLKGHYRKGSSLGYREDDCTTVARSCQVRRNGA